MKLLVLTINITYIYIYIAKPHVDHVDTKTKKSYLHVYIGERNLIKLHQLHETEILKSVANDVVTKARMAAVLNFLAKH